MKRPTVPAAVLTAVLLVSGAVLLVARSAGALPGETFVLQQSDRIIAEAPGCHVSCGISTPLRRECTVREPDCHVTCTIIPECKPDGARAIQVCAILRDRP